MKYTDFSLNEADFRKSLDLPDSPNVWQLSSKGLAKVIDMNVAMERAAIVKYLKDDPDSVDANYIAEEIERGEHLK